MDFLILLFGIPVGAVLGGLAGRWAQRKLWHLDLPYDARVRLLRQGGR